MSATSTFTVTGVLNRFAHLLWPSLACATALCLPLAAAVPSSASSGKGSEAVQPAGSADDRVLVRVKDGQDLTALHRQLGTRGRKLFRRATRGRGPDLEVVELPRGRREEVLAALRASGLVEYAEPDYRMKALVEPNDFRFYDGSQWNLKNTGINGGTVGADIDAPAAWDLRNSAAGVIVAVVDTGVRLTHEDLRGNLWTNPGETGTDAAGHNKATNGIDDDGDGYIDDVHGINAITGSGNPTDDYGHGTHVAGIIGATGNNSVGITGVAWRVQLMALKALDATGQGTISDAIECLDYARAHGAKIVNASWGSYQFTSQALRDAITNLRDAGIIFVAACGNSSADNDANPLYPASYEFDNIISVAASTRTDQAASFTDWGHTTVDLAAPGAAVFSTWNGADNDYRYNDGTSMAAPHVAGAAALIWALNPALTYRQVIAAILTNTDPLPDFAGKTVTGGRLNLALALSAVVPPGSERVPPEVSMSRPRLASTVRGTAVTVAATATDNVRVASVQFTLDGQDFGPELTSAPYIFTWNSTTVANGVHVIGAHASDTSGNKTTALAGAVTVKN
ncbi:MAG: Subtilase family protein [Lacunisphaera sp.]|nr:Subtilase family protein [Lacunisphaera sp.]